MSPLPAFLAWLGLEKRYSPHTLLAYERDLEQFLAFHLQRTDAAPDWSALASRDVRAWLIHLHESGLAARSRQRKLSSLRTFFRFLRMQGLMKQDPLRGIRAPKLPQRVPSHVEENAMARFFSELDKLDEGREEGRPGFSHMRDHSIMELLYGAGLRRGELLGLLLKDVDLTAGRLRVRGKGRKERVLPLTPALGDRLADYLKVRSVHFGERDSRSLFLTDRGKPVYPSMVYRLVRKYLSLIQAAEKHSPHVLRHSFATHLTAAGADLGAVRDLLGHQSLASTQVYTHHAMQRLMEVYRQAHPRSGE